MTDRPFPPGFLWGVASAGHQNEGDNVNSDTWFLENVEPTVFKDKSGKACNGYELWRSDVDLAADMGLTAYRFSVEWARVEPAPGEFSEEALSHYAAITDHALERGMAPVVTLNHFTSPHWFAMRGGWLDARAPELFARYAERVMDHFGDRIAYLVTFNEPDLPHMLEWAGLPAFVRDLERATLEAASTAAGVPRYRAANVMLPEDFDVMGDGMTAGHLAAKSVVKAHRPDLPVGLSLALVDDRVVGDDPSVRDRKRAEVYDRWLELARDDDFIGVQNYECNYYDGAGPVSADGSPHVPGLYADVDPSSLGQVVRYTYAATGVPVFVTEHGRATPDDSVRADFIEPSLAGLLDAIEDGVPVIGYCHWTLMDNFEWIFGYDPQLGLHEVDRETFVRTPKPSAGVYAAVARANGLPTSSD